MQKDEAELIKRLQAIDGELEFDADAFTQRVVSIRSRRRRLRTLSGCCAVLAVLLAGLVWRVSRDPARSVVIDHRSKSGNSSIDDQGRNDRVDAIVEELNQQQERLARLLDRIEQNRTAIVASRTKHNDAMLALYRAELSESVAVPELSDFFVGRTDQPAN